jgi:hypothetical protein
VRRIQNQVGQRAFSGWFTSVKERRSTRVLMQRFLGRWHKQKLAASWGGWVDFRDGRQRQRLLVRRIVGRLVGRTELETFRVWQHFTFQQSPGWNLSFLSRQEVEDEVKALEAALSEAKSENTELVARVDQLIERMDTDRLSLNEDMAQTMADMQEDYAALRQKQANQIISAWHGQCMATAFRSWKEVLAQKKRQRTLLRRFSVKWANQAASRSMGAWRSFVAVRKSQKQRVSKFLGRWRNSGVTLTFEAWAGWAKENVAQRVLLRRFGKRLQNRTAIAAFDSWLEFVENRDMARTFLNKMLGRFLHQEVARGFLQWQRFLGVLAAVAAGSQMKAEAELKRQRALKVIAGIMMQCQARAFSGWRGAVGALKSQRVLVTRFLRKWNNQAVLQSFMAFVDFREVRQHARNHMRKILGWLENRELSSGWRCWLRWDHAVQDAARATEMDVLRGAELLAFRKEAEALEHDLRNKRKLQAEQMIRNWQNASLATCFRQWTGMVAEMRRQREVLGRFSKRIMNRAAVRALGAWTDVVATRKQHRATVTRFLKRWRKQALCAVLLPWHRYTEDQKKQRVILRRFARKMRNGQAARAFLAWDSFVGRRLRAKTLVQTVFRRLVTGKAEAAFASWVDLVHCQQEEADEAHRLQVVVRRCLAKINSRCIETAFSTWAHMVAVKQDMRVKLERAVGKIQQRVVAASLASWVDYYDIRVRARFLCGKVFGRLVSGKAGAAFASWVSEVHCQQEEATAAQRQQVVVRRCLARINNRCTHGAFSAWTDAVAAKKDMRAKLVRAAAKMQQRVVVASMNAWADYSEARIRARYICGTVFGKLKQSHLVTAWHSWATATELRREMIKYTTHVEASSVLKTHQFKINQFTLRKATRRLKKQAAALSFTGWVVYYMRRKQRRVLLRRTAAKLSRRSLATAFEGWMSYYERRRRARYLSGRVFGQLKSSTLGAAWHTWTRIIGEQKTKGDEERRERVVVQRCMAKMNHRCLHGAYAGWAATVAARRELRTRLRRAAARMQARTMAASFQGWVAHCDWRIRARYVAAKVFGQLTHGQQTVAWRSWTAQVNNQKAEMEETQYIHTIVRRSLARLQARCVQRAFAAWSAATATSRESRHLLQRAGSKLQSRAMAAAFGSWAAFYERRLRARYLAGKVFVQLVSAQLAAAWSSWTAMIRHQHAEADEAQRQQRVVQRCLAKIQSRCVDGAFLLWIQMVEENKTMRVKLARAASKMQLRAAAASFNTWTGYYERRLRARLLCGKVFGRLVSGKAGAAFASWVGEVCCQQDKADEAQRQQAVVRRCLARINNRCTHGVFSAWINAVAAKKDMRAKLLRAAAKMQQRVVVASMNAWADYSEARGRARFLGGKVFGKMASGKTRAAWTSWTILTRCLRKEAVQARRHFVIIRRSVIRIEKRVVSRAHARWVDYVGCRRRARYLAGKAFGTMANGKLGMAWRGWNDRVRDERYREAALRLSEGKVAKAVEALEEKRRRELPTAIQMIAAEQRKTLQRLVKAANGHRRNRLLYGWMRWRAQCLLTRQSNTLSQAIIRLEMLKQCHRQYALLRVYRSSALKSSCKAFFKWANASSSSALSVRLNQKQAALSVTRALEFRQRIALRSLQIRILERERRTQAVALTTWRHMHLGGRVLADHHELSEFYERRTTAIVRKSFKTMEQLVLRIERQHVCAIRRVMLRVSRSLERMAIRFWYTAVGLGRDQVARIGRLGAAHYWPPSPVLGIHGNKENRSPLPLPATETLRPSQFQAIASSPLPPPPPEHSSSYAVQRPFPTRTPPPSARLRVASLPESRGHEAVFFNHDGSGTTARYEAGAGEEEGAGGNAYYSRRYSLGKVVLAREGVLLAKAFDRLRPLKPRVVTLGAKVVSDGDDRPSVDVPPGLSLLRTRTLRRSDTTHSLVPAETEEEEGEAAAEKVAAKAAAATTCEAGEEEEEEVAEKEADLAEAAASSLTSFIDDASARRTHSRASRASSVLSMDSSLHSLGRLSAATSTLSDGDETASTLFGDEWSEPAE